MLINGQLKNNSEPTLGQKDDRVFSNYELFKIFKPYLIPHRGRIFFAVLALLIIAGSLLGMGRGLAFLIDQGLGKYDKALLRQAVLGTTAIAAFLAIGSYLRATMVNEIGERVFADVRRAIFKNVLSLSAAWYENARKGNILSSIITDTSVMQLVMTSTLSQAARNTLLVIGGLFMLVISSPKMSLVVIIVVPVIILPLITLARKLRSASRQMQDCLAGVAVEAEETLSSIYIVQAFGRQTLRQDIFDKKVSEALNAGLDQVRLRGLLSGVVIFVVFVGIGLILWIGGQDLLAGRISAGDLSSFVFYAFLVASSTGFLSELAGDLQRAAGAADRIAQLLEAKENLREIQNPQILDMRSQSACAFDSVGFAYPSAMSRSAISDVSFEIKVGEHIAIVGPSGSGKSTIFNLLLRFFDPTNGNVFICGSDLRSLAIKDIRRHIGLVPQEGMLFSSSIRENIAFGRPTADDKMIVDAAKQAQADGFIADIELGYDAIVGEKGVRLSGGQRQRITIARAILSDPQLLLLDEATSALDAQSELDVQNALNNLMRGRTSLVIAHRLATVLRADRILLMDRGRLVATGTHETLLAVSPLYRNLAALQFSQTEC